MWMLIALGLTNFRNGFSKSIAQISSDQMDRSFQMARLLGENEIQQMVKRVNEERILHHPNFADEDLAFLESIEFVSPFEDSTDVKVTRGFKTTGKSKKGKIYYHNGLDLITGNKNWNLVAAADGIISEVRVSASHGNSIIIELLPSDDYLQSNPNPVHKYYLLYAHLAKRPKIPAGTRVYAGDLVGVMGNTGDSDGYHLHIEVLKDLVGGKITGYTEKYTLNAFAFPHMFKALTGIEPKTVD